MKVLICLFVSLLSATAVNSQLLDLLRIEYTNALGDDSNFDFQRKRFLFNYPVPTGRTGYLFLGLDYSAIDLDLHDEVSGFDKTRTDDFRLLDFNLTYTSLINDDWRFAARFVPGFSSNLEGTGLLFEDVFFSGAVVFIKDKKESSDVLKPFRIIMGLAYSGNSGIVFPIPFLSFYKKFHPKWSYNVGVPVTNLQFHATELFRIKLFGRLDGFNSNLQDGIMVNVTESANRIRMSLVLAGFRYEYKLAERIELYLNTTRSLTGRLQLRNGRDNILRLDRANVFHYNGGIRVKI
ncbi:MAG: DUF6268 family outer membrane beta-barrel protein [Cyclobacteriaceae bacterium]